MAEAPPVLELRGVHAAYGQIEVLHGIDLSVTTGSVLALLGPNGAGKSTTLRVASGQMEPTSGCFHLLGRHANGLRPDALARAGLCTLPDGRGIFPNLSVTENLRLMTYAGPSRSQVEDMAFRRFPRLAERRHHKGAALSGGERQMLAVGRALLAGPRVLMLDEPSAGLAPRLISDLLSRIRLLVDRGLPVLLVEQNVKAALKVVDHLYLLERGRILGAGPAKEMAADHRIVETYLGTIAEAAP